MKVGKISEVALSRAVFKQLKNRRDEVLFGGSIGEDCAAMKLGKGEVCVISSNPVTGAGKIQGALAVYSAVNNLVTSGAEAIGVMMTVLLPEDFKESFEKIYNADELTNRLIKAADKISAYIKCIEEESAGNKEFSQAKQATEKAIGKIDLPEVKYFMETFIPAYYLTLDEI